MLDSEEFSKTLHAIMTGFPDRAKNIIGTSANLDDNERGILQKAMADAPSDAGVLEAIGDALRVSNADKTLVNEAYRAAFYNSERGSRSSTIHFLRFFPQTRPVTFSTSGSITSRSTPDI